MARYEQCVERIKKLLLNRGFSPAVAAEADHSPDTNQPKQPRKVNGAGLGRAVIGLVACERWCGPWRGAGFISAKNDEFLHGIV